MFWNKIFNHRLILGLSRPCAGFSVLFHGAVLCAAALPTLLHPPAPPEPYRAPPEVFFQFSRTPPSEEPDSDLKPVEPEDEPALSPWEPREPRETFEPVAPAAEAIPPIPAPLPAWKPVRGQVAHRPPQREPKSTQAPAAARPLPPPLRATPPARPTRSRSTEGFVAARKLTGSCPKPRYPRAAVRRRLEGRVVLLVRIDEEGRPVAITIAESSGRAMFDRAAERAVRKWRFVPARRNGVAVEDTIRVPIRFSLSGR